MIKARGSLRGREVLILGLSFANLDKLRAEVGNGYIEVSGKQVGLPIDIHIIAGETEAHIVQQLSGGMDENTVVVTEPRLKN